MKSLLTLMALTLAVICDARSNSSLPYPWLSLDRSAKVLHLVCRPPPQALEPSSTWQYVDDLRLFAFLPQHNFISNVSLVSMISSWTEPKANPKFSISRASFQGTWSSKSVSLEYMFPVTNKELGHYFCAVDYRDKNDMIQRFATRAVVDASFVFSHVRTKPKTEQNFEVRVSDAHKVHVTWTKPEQSQFREASVSFELMGEGGKSKGPLVSLFATNGDTDFVIGSEVLLKKVNYQDGNNMSITLFVKRDQQEADYRYACWVPYSSCRGENKVSCTCCQQGNNPDRQVCPTAAENPKTYFSEFISAVLVALFLFLVCCVIAIFLFKTRTSSKCSSLLKGFSPKPEIGSTLEDKKLCPSAGSLSKDSVEEQSDHMKPSSPLLPTIAPPSGQNDKGRKETGVTNVRKVCRAHTGNKTETAADDDIDDHMKPSSPLLLTIAPPSGQNDKGRKETGVTNVRKVCRAHTGNKTETAADDVIDDKQPLAVLLPIQTDTSNTSRHLESEMDRDIH